MGAIRIRSVCSGCGYEAPAEDPFPFRCPRATAGDDIDHVLARVVQEDWPLDAARAVFLDPEPNPFLRYRKLFRSYGAAREGGLSDGDFAGIVTDLDAAVAAVDGTGFRETPFGPDPRLGEAVGGGGALWVKDETGNVSGSHKARHLMGILLWLRLMERLGRVSGAPRLAIASCGNAALAAGVVARAAGLDLDVYVPPDAPAPVVARLEALGSGLNRCPRIAGRTGDPCFHAFREAVAGGSLPFTVQGSENGLTLEGGETLGYEMVSSLLREGRSLERVFVQVGGGALASSTIQAFREAVAWGFLDRLPRFHAVQTEGGYPLARAYERLVDHVLSEGNAGAAPPKTGFEQAAWIQEHVSRATLDAGLHHAATHRSRFMWPWETEPRSVAGGILDDETYDWLAVVRGMLESGGFPIVVSEDTLRDAARIAGETTTIPADPTGTSGLAGLLAVREEIPAGESVAVLLTGVDRERSA